MWPLLRPKSPGGTPWAAQLGDTVNQIAVRLQRKPGSEYKITPVFKGTYEETLTAGIAAFRAGEQPNIMQVFDAGAATVIGAKGATIPVQDLLADNGVDFDINDYIAGVRYFYADSDGKMIGMPFNSSTPIMYFNMDALEKAGVTPPKTWEEFQSVTAPALKGAGYTAAVSVAPAVDLHRKLHVAPQPAVCDQQQRL